MGDDTLLRFVEQQIDTATAGGAIDVRALAALAKLKVGGETSLADLEALVIDVAQRRGVGVLLGEPPHG